MSSNSKPNSPYQDSSLVESPYEWIQLLDNWQALSLWTTNSSLAEGWKEDQTLRNAILRRYLELDPKQIHKKNFANEAFWAAGPHYLDPLDVPDGFTVVDEWNEEMEDVQQLPDGFQVVDDWKEEQIPYMLEKDFIQAGGNVGQLKQAPKPNVEDLYELRVGHQQSSKKFFTNRKYLEMQFKNTSQMDDFDQQAAEVWDSVLKKVVEKPTAEDKVSLTIKHDCLDKPIFVKFTPFNKLTGNMIANEVAKVQQSKKELQYGMDMGISITHFRAGFKGSGFKRDRQGGILPYRNNNSNNRIFYTIENSDNLCCARAIVTVRASIENDPKWEFNQEGRQKQMHTTQKNLAQELMEKAGLKDHKGPCGYEELSKLQEALQWYQIKVWDNSAKLIFCGSPATKVIHLHFNEGEQHYNGIAKILAFHNVSRFCEHCNKGYQQRRPRV